MSRQGGGRGPSLGHCLRVTPMQPACKTPRPPPPSRVYGLVEVGAAHVSPSNGTLVTRPLLLLHLYVTVIAEFGELYYLLVSIHVYGTRIHQ